MSARAIRNITRTWRRSIAAETPGAFYVNQFANPANPLAHETTTGPEIWEQLGGDVDAVVVGVGSGGTLTGLGASSPKTSPKTEMVLADPIGSVLAPLVKTGEMIEAGSWTVEGIGEDFVPPNADLSLVKKAYSVTDQQSMRGGARPAVRGGHPRRLVLGHAAGGGAALLPRADGGRSASSPSSATAGNKYLSKVFDDFWLAEQGLAERVQHGDLRDLVARSHREGGTVLGRAGRHAAHRLWPHAPRRRLAASGAGGRQADRHHRRKRHPGSASKVPMTAAGTASTRRCAHRHDRRRCTRCRPPRRSTRCCRCSSATRWPSSSTATNSSGLITRVDLINHLRRSRRDDRQEPPGLLDPHHPWRPEPSTRPPAR